MTFVMGLKVRVLLNIILTQSSLFSMVTGMRARTVPDRLKALCFQKAFVQKEAFRVNDQAVQPEPFPSLLLCEPIKLAEVEYGEDESSFRKILLISPVACRDWIDKGTYDSNTIRPLFLGGF